MPKRLRSWELYIIGKLRDSTFVWLGLLVSAVSSLLKSRAAVQLENVALRHQLAVLQRSVKRPRLNSSDRLLWVWFSRVWGDWRSALVIVKPDTVIAWHRTAFRMLWTWKIRRGKRGRPAVSAEIRGLIRRMSRENPSWGAAHSRRVAQARHQYRRDQREQIPRPQPKATIADVADVS
jgi:hypothetical protein